MRVCPICGVQWGMTHQCTTNCTPHLHGEYIEGCFRCDLSRDEVSAND